MPRSFSVLSGFNQHQRLAALLLTLVVVVGCGDSSAPESTPVESEPGISSVELNDNGEPTESAGLTALPTGSPEAETPASVTASSTPQQMRSTIKIVEGGPRSEPPVVWNFQEIALEGQKKTIRFEVINQTDRQIEQVKVLLRYLDVKGEVHSTFGHSESNLAANERTVRDVSGLFLKPETARLTAEVRLVRFGDGSDWNRSRDAPVSDQPLVRGRADLKLSREDALHLGYVGLGDDGRGYGNGIGSTRVSAESTDNWFANYSFAPQIAELQIPDGRECRFNCRNLVAGRYFVYLRRGEHQVTGRWVSVLPETTVELQLSVDDSLGVPLEVSLPSVSTAKQVRLIPLWSEESSLLSETELKSSQHWFDDIIQPADVADGTARFEQLLPGRYRVLADFQEIDVLVTDTTDSTRFNGSGNMRTTIDDFAR